jgi:hypothetical protein
LGLLTGVALGALLGAGQATQALVITPSFDATWATNPNVAAATGVVNSVIAEFQADFNNPVTITVAFGWGEVRGIALTGGAASTFDAADFTTNQFTLAQTKAFYNTAVGLQPTNAVLATANANLPATYPNPGGATTFFIPDSEYKALTGLAFDNDPIDGYTGYATNFCGPGPACAYDYSGGPPPAGTVDFKAVVEHEVSHAMGRVDFAFASGVQNGAPPFLTPLDFFKYDLVGTNLDPRFNITKFSFDGGITNPGGRTFSNQSDSGDWINFPADSNNAFAFLGTQAFFSPQDIQEMCALGYQGCAVTPAPEPGTLALLATSLFGLAALRRRRK